MDRIWIEHFFYLEITRSSLASHRATQRRHIEPYVKVAIFAKGHLNDRSSQPKKALQKVRMRLPQTSISVERCSEFRLFVSMARSLSKFR